MPFDSWLIFCLSAFISAASPGPSVIHAMRLSGNNGFKLSTASILGNTLSIFIICAMASSGLVILNNDKAIFIIKTLGALYLIYIGMKILLSSDFQAIENGKVRKSYMTCLIEAALISISNPKIFIFIASFFPQFLSKDYAIAPQLVTMTFTFAFFTSSTLVAYTLFSAVMYKNEVSRAIINKGSGIALVLFGGFMLFH
ncbi:LysE family translocator [Pseudomonas fulva]|uniref:LysE family translocator n=1 Tax=Pseudomonas fulva TaxID=47880 RepID=UPI00201E3861|nr:LysE family translocator [Pseudomonas fulva]UQY35107.1 LysE family translocator [Pseudomonas fulva]